MEVSFANGKYIVEFTPAEQALVNEDEQKNGPSLLGRLGITWFTERGLAFDGMSTTEAENTYSSLPEVSKLQIMKIMRGEVL